MSTDDFTTVDLTPDYAMPWDELLQSVTGYTLGKDVRIYTWPDREIAKVSGRGCIIGQATGEVLNLEDTTGDYLVIEATTWETHAWTFSRLNDLYSGRRYCLPSARLFRRYSCPPL